MTQLTDPPELLKVLNQLAEIEARAKAGGVSVNKICAEAGINPTTWGRWKNRTMSPTAVNLYAVENALQRLLEKKSAAA